MFGGRTAAVVPLVMLPASARGMTASSVTTGPSLVGLASPVPVLGVPKASGASADVCVMAYTMAVIPFLVCCKALALGMFVTTSCALDGFVRYGSSILVY